MPSAASEPQAAAATGVVASAAAAESSFVILTGQPTTPARVDKPAGKATRPRALPSTTTEPNTVSRGRVKWTRIVWDAHGNSAASAGLSLSFEVQDASVEDDMDSQEITSSCEPELDAQAEFYLVGKQAVGEGSTTDLDFLDNNEQDVMNAQLTSDIHLMADAADGQAQRLEQQESVEKRTRDVLAKEMDQLGNHAVRSS